MAGILFKIAKEFNVATTTIVDFLMSKGFDIENKPNAKISDEMYSALGSEFKSSAAIKEKADQIQIGASFKKPDEKPAIPAFKIEPLTKELPIVPKAPEPKVEVPTEEVIAAKADVPGLTILGKMDLTPKPKVVKEKKR